MADREWPTRHRQVATPCEPLHPLRVFVDGAEYCPEPECWGEKNHLGRHANRHGSFEATVASKGDG